jgi:hypothetical protein
MSEYAPIQNQTNINKDVSFFATVSTVGATSAVGVIQGDYAVGELAFGLQGGGLISGTGLEVVGTVDPSAAGGVTSTLCVVAQPAGDAPTPGFVGLGQLYFERPNGSGTACSVISPYSENQTATVGITIQASNVICNELDVTYTGTFAAVTVSTINGSKYTNGLVFQAGLGETDTGGASTITLATPYLTPNFEVLITQISPAGTVYNANIVSSVSISSFQVLSLAGSTPFGWVTSGV